MMKRPLDGRIFPEGEPEPTEAEFHAEWAKVNEVMEAAESNDDDLDAGLQRADVLENFVRRHHRRMKAMGMPTQEFLDGVVRLRARVLDHRERLDQATEAVLQAQANLADRTPEAVELCLSIAAELKKNLPGATATAREAWGPILQEIEEGREEWLAELPLEDRRRLEAKYPR